MLWTYRIFRDDRGRYSIREVFYDRNNTTIINYSNPVAVVGTSIEELIQLVQWFKEAFDLPVLSLEEVDTQVAAQSSQQSNRNKNISLNQVIAELVTDSDSITQE